MERRPRTAVVHVTRRGTVSSIRATVPMANNRVMRNRPTVNRMTLSRNKVVAMIRGVSWPLAIWMATISEPNVKTINESVSVMIVCRAVSVPAVDRGQGGIQSADASTAEMTCSAICSRSRATKGTIQSEDRT
jgi:hypothetical protein